MLETPHVYFSVRTRHDLAVEAAGGAPKEETHRVGGANYTYRIVAGRFLALLRSHGIESTELKRPEMYDRTTVPGSGAAQSRPIHLIFKPAEEIRIVRGARNIGVIYWEFDKLVERSHFENVTHNQVRMLGLLDEIWVANSYLKAVLQSYGIKNVHVVPCPVPAFPADPTQVKFQDRFGELPATPLRYERTLRPAPVRITPLRTLLPSSAGSDDAPLFLSILNPLDRRKDIESLLFGFMGMPVQEGREPILLVKMIVDNIRFGLADLPGILLEQSKAVTSLSSRHIVFVSSFLAEQDLAWLYASCRFYVTTSRAEGQNLPLIESIRHGCVPVSPAHTAMADYISAETAVVIPSTRKRAHPASNVFGAHSLFWYQCHPCDVGQALVHALALSDSGRRSLSRVARLSVERFSPEAVWTALEARLQAFS